MQLVRECAVTFGRIVSLFEHSFNLKLFMWSVVEQFGSPVMDRESALWYVNKDVCVKRVVLICDLSKPLVTAQDDDFYWFLDSLFSTCYFCINYIFF